MTHYRLYFLDDHGRIDSARDLQAPTEDAAYEHAELLSEGRDWQLWRGSEVIAKSIFTRQREAQSSCMVHERDLVRSYRAKAEQLRAIAASDEVRHTRQTLLDVADAYDYRADNIVAIQRDLDKLTNRGQAAKPDNAQARSDTGTAG